MGIRRCTDGVHPVHSVLPLSDLHRVSCWAKACARGVLGKLARSVQRVPGRGGVYRAAVGRARGLRPQRTCVRLSCALPGLPTHGEERLYSPWPRLLLCFSSSSLTLTLARSCLTHIFLLFRDAEPRRGGEGDGRRTAVAAHTCAGGPASLAGCAHVDVVAAANRGPLALVRPLLLHVVTRQSAHTHHEALPLLFTSPAPRVARLFLSAPLLACARRPQPAARDPLVPPHALSSRLCCNATRCASVRAPRKRFAPSGAPCARKAAGKQEKSNAKQESGSGSEAHGCRAHSPGDVSARAAARPTRAAPAASAARAAAPGCAPRPAAPRPGTTCAASRAYGAAAPRPEATQPVRSVRGLAPLAGTSLNESAHRK